MSDDLKEFGFEPLDEFGFEPIEEVEETESEASQTLQDFFQGAAQGSTFGFFDELAGAASTAIDPLLTRLASGDVDKQLESQGFNIDQDTTYEQERDRFRDIYKRGEERSPIADFLGGLAGGALPAGQSISAVSKLVSKSPLIQSLVARQGEGAVNTLLSKVLPKALEVGAVGATEGLAYGAGQSEGETLSDVAEDALVAGGIGGVAGGLAGGALAKGQDTLQKLGKKINQYSDDSDFLRGIKKSFSVGEEGLSTVNKSQKESLKKYSESMKDIPDNVNLPVKKHEITGDALDLYKSQVGDFSDDLLKLDKKLSQDVNQALIDAEQSGFATIALPNEMIEDVNKFYSQMNKQPFNPENIHTEFTPVELKDIKNYIYNSFKKFRPEMGGFTEQQLEMQELGRNLDTFLKDTIPAYRDTSSKLYDYRKNVLEKIIRPEDPRFKFATLGDDENKKAVLKKALDKEYIAPQFLSNMETRQSPEIAESVMKYLNRTSPENLDVLGIKNVEDYIEKTGGMSDLYNAVVMSSKDPTLNPQKGTLKGTIIEDVLGYGKSAMGRAANVVGLAQTEAPKQFLPKVVKKIGSLYNLPKNTMTEIGSQFQQSSSPTLAKYGKNLTDAIERGDDVGTKAAVFVMMQNPESREFLNVLGFGDEKK